MSRSAIADFEIKDLLIRRRLMESHDSFGEINKDFLGLRFEVGGQVSRYAEQRTSALDATSHLPDAGPWNGDEPSEDSRSIQGYRKRQAYVQHIRLLEAQQQLRYVNQLRCQQKAVLNFELIRKVRTIVRRNHVPIAAVNFNTANFFDISPRFHRMFRSYQERAERLDDIVRQFIFVTPAVVAPGMASLALRGAEHALSDHANEYSNFDAVLHHASVRRQIAFPDPGLLQYDCGKLQELSRLLRERKSGGHRVLIFTQMTRILDILEIFLNFHGWLYLRLDGATKIEDRQYVTERFNADTRIFAFISSSRSGGVGVK
jgi:helicase SWR1